MIPNYIKWNFDPVFIDLGFIEIRWYAMMFICAFIAGYFVMKKLFKRDGISMAVLESLWIWVFFAVLIGARLGHVLFYQPDYYFANPSEILMTWKGGLSSHGAAFLVPVVLIFFAKKNKIPYLNLLDRVVIAFSLGGMFVRLGNLCNSEIYGHQTTMPWGFIFVRDGQTLPKHPTQLYEAIAVFLIFLALYKIFTKYYKKLPDGLIFGLFLTGLFTFRFFIEFIKEVQVEFEKNMEYDMGQWLSIPLILFGIGLVIYSIMQQRKKLLQTEIEKNIKSL